MLQENSFFSKPLIFYGSNQQEKSEEEDENFSASWQISFDSITQIQSHFNVGLFLDWSDVSE